ncbi:MAG: glycerol-3-phosphate acyltransferase [Ignavibacterium sp.]|nr:glycerol-3-phosphate acyltransferase [Ignavibacterium sp.]
MHYLISLFIGYLFGSIPTAYILLKKKKGIDITKTGSGNVGAMNSFEVTNSKLIGLFVLLIDFLKGLLSVYIVSLIYPESFVLPAVALLFAILSHCFNPWLKFKGGRGLATAAGGTSILFPYFLFAWIVLWLIFYFLKKDILIGNVAANIFTLFLIANTSEIAIKYSYPQAKSESELMLFVIGGLLIIFIKHIEPLNEIILKFKKPGMRNDNI